MMGITEMRNAEDLAPVYSLKNQNLNYVTLESNEYPSGTIVTTNMNCGNDKTVLVFRDSYTVALIQFLSLHFKKVIYVNTDYKNNYLVDPILIDQIKPNVVMWLRVERYLNNLIVK